MNQLDIQRRKIEGFNKDMVTLESIKYGLEMTLSHGGIDTCSVDIVNTTLTNISKRNGLSNSAISVEDNSDNVETTKVSMEKVSETLGNLAKGAAKLIRNLWRKLKAIARKLFSREEKVKSNMEVVVRKAKEYEKQPDAKPNANVKVKVSPKYASTMSIDGKLVGGSAYKNAFENTAEVLGEVLIKNYPDLEGLLSMLKGFKYDGTDGEDSGAKQNIEQLNSWLEKQRGQLKELESKVKGKTFFPYTFSDLDKPWVFATPTENGYDFSFKVKPLNKIERDLPDGDVEIDSISGSDSIDIGITMVASTVDVIQAEGSLRERGIKLEDSILDRMQDTQDKGNYNPKDYAQHAFQLYLDVSGWYLKIRAAHTAAGEAYSQLAMASLKKYASSFKSAAPNEEQRKIDE